jgi:hypothetical protein
MIHELGRSLQTQLASKGCPFKVFDREAFKTAGTSRQRIVIEFDKTARDKWGAPALSRNPKHYFIHSPACKITIYAQSTRANATEFEHDEAALDAAYAVANAMRVVLADLDIGLFMPTDGGFIRPEDLADSERIGGSVYEIKFTFNNGVEDLTWAGAEATEYTFGANSVTSTTSVSRYRGTDDDGDDTTVPAAAETACGG